MPPFFSLLTITMVLSLTQSVSAFVDVDVNRRLHPVSSTGRTMKDALLCILLLLMATTVL